MAGAYPDLLASGVNNLGRFDQFDLFAGESDIVTDQFQAADGQAISQFQVCALDVNGRVVPWDGSEFGYASGTITFTGQPVNNETMSINGVTITAKTSGATGAQFNIGATSAATAANLLALLNGTSYSVDVNTNMPVYSVAPLAGTGVTATIDTTGLVITLHAVAPGTAGNSIVLTESLTNVAVSGSGTLAGGAAETDTQIKMATCIAAQAIAAATPGGWGPFFVGGIFNHSALVWPDGVQTTAQQKRAFAGTDIGVRQLL